jgi:hypothetical protein
LEILPVLPNNAEFTGQVFLEGEFVVGKGLTGAPSRLDLATMVLQPIKTPENTIQGGYQVSPNRQQVASWKSYFDANEHKTSVSVVIEDNTGKTLAEVPGDLEAWDAFYWLDNERIVIGTYSQPYVLNPFTGEAFDISEWYAQSPGGLHIGPVWETNGVFDKKLNLLFYIQEGLKMLLWDIEKQQILATLQPQVSYVPGDRPKWAWDDSQLVIGYKMSKNASDELFSISRDGQLIQLTELGKYYPRVRISKLNWSPDGQQIAFFFKDYSNQENPWQLAILYIKTHEVTNYCGLAGWMRPPVEPIWSPDGNQLLIGRAEMDEVAYSTILIDLSQGYAAKLADNLVPSGWMVAPE